MQAVDPAQADFGLALAGLHNRLAWALADVLPPREIEQHHRTALALFEQLAGTFPHARLTGELPYDDPLDGVAHSQLHLANVLRDADEVDALRLAAWQHFQQRVAAKPRSQWHRAQLAEITLSLRDGDVRQGVAMLEELHNEFPSVPQHKYRLACACERLGAMLRRDPAQQPDAEQYLRRAVQLLTELTRDFPDTPDYHSHLAAALDTLMSLPRNIIRLEEARQLIDVAIERQTAAVQANPAHRQYREYLAAHFGNLAAVLEQLGEHDGVDRAYVRRIELLRTRERRRAAVRT